MNTKRARHPHLPQDSQPRQYVRSLVTGWRFTLPSTIRKSYGWHEGTLLLAEVQTPRLLLRLPGDHPGGSTGLYGSCYVGSGGKVVVPSYLRSQLGWQIGERLSVSAGDGVVTVTPCCPRKACASCGSLMGVRQVIPGLFLCESCWGRLVSLYASSPHVLQEGYKNV